MVTVGNSDTCSITSYTANSISCVSLQSGVAVATVVVSLVVNVHLCKNQGCKNIYV